MPDNEPASVELNGFLNGQSDNISAPGRADSSAGSAQPIDEHTASSLDDINPRSPKRRRLSSTDNDDEIDFEAAAARALAISQGHEQPVSEQANPKNDVHERTPRSLVLTPPLMNYQTRLDNLPIVDQAATQILLTLAKMSHTEIGEMLFGPPSQKYRDYQILKDKFEQAKKIYLTNSPFISLPALGFTQGEQIETVRKANMATFMASIFSGEIGLRIMDMNFLDVFVPENGRLLKAQASIYLELKTQAFIAAKRTAPSMLEQVMVELFPSNTDKHLLSKRPGAKSLAPSEQDFLKRVVSRRDILYADMHHKRLNGLENRYRWDDFSREVNAYLVKNCDYLLTGVKEKTEQSTSTSRSQLQQGQMENQFSLAVTESSRVDTEQTTVSSGETDLDSGFDIDSFVARAARAAEMAMQEGPTGLSYAASAPHEDRSLPVSSLGQSLSSTRADLQDLQVEARASSANRQAKEDSAITPQPDFQHYKPVNLEEVSAVDDSNEEVEVGEVPHKSQTAPTQVLYERARMVTTNKASPSGRKPNPPSHRRPWTNEEENALMTGLDQVKGPHWSQILAMYGPGGTINESLKDRNQVQLKDKARNLKLFFLKAGIEVPYYLQAVTGDLKTRAPGQAEKREAKQRERMITEGADMVIQPDSLQVDMFDEPDEDITANANQTNTLVSEPDRQGDIESQGSQAAQLDGDDEDDLDMEAMVARAAASASATQGYSNAWT